MNRIKYYKVIGNHHAGDLRANSINNLFLIGSSINSTKFHRKIMKLI